MIDSNYSGFRFSSLALSMLLMASGQVLGMGMMDGQGMGMMGGSSARHRYFMRNGLDAKYARVVNPLPATAENLNDGKSLYGQYCSSCHGAGGYGDGTAGRSLTPPPTDLTRLARMPMASDGYLYWSISEGGAQFHTAMPAMKGSLKESDIWKIILHLRNL